MTINTATATIEDIKQAPTSELVDLYNKVCGQNIKKFTDRKTAESRVWKVIQQLAPGENVEAETNIKPIKEKPATKTPKKRDEAEGRIIKVLVEENKKKPGSRAHRKFEILMAHDGKTVKEFKGCEGRYSTLDDEPGWPATELRWAVKLELVKILKQ